ncbi:MAG: polar amino acid transport system permease protein [Thermoleophilaceae bacterium]|jgi:polar amino acid transport system permease protein|nr:polar amino acid transport system permease protein [Thermoleophilaceae bacterium]
MDVVVKQYFDFPFMWEHSGVVLAGFWITVQLSLWAGAFSLIWGLILALLRSLPGRWAKPVRAITIAYIDVFRGIPLLIIILLVGGSLAFISVLPRWLRIPEFFGYPEVFWYGVMAITITYGAYFAEVYRAGIDAVPRGQIEASRSLGMGRWATMRFVTLPQAIRKVLPPFLNDYTALMKDTSLVSVLGLPEAVRVGRELQSEYFNASGLILGALLFLLFTLPLARLVDRQIKKQNIRFQRAP